MKRADSVVESFGYAFRGLWYALNTQRNLRIHFFAAACILVLGWFLALPSRAFISVLTAVMVVMVAEMLNTAVESVVDLASPEFHELARIAKDVAAGAVLLAAMGAAALGIWVFAEPVLELPRRIVVRFNHQPVVSVLLLTMVAAILALILWISRRPRRTRA